MDIKKKDEIEEEVEETTEEKPETEEAEETEETEEKDIEEATKKVAGQISKYLDLEGLKKKIDNFMKREDVKSKIYGIGDTKKDVSTLTKDEKIVGFFKALLQNDVPVLKALSEGVAADGGYLVPDEKFVAL